MTKQSFGPAAQYRYPPPLERKRDEASRQYSFKGIVRKLLFRLSDESESKGIDWRNTFSTPSNPAQLMGGDSVISFAQLHPLRPPSPPPLGLGRPRDETYRYDDTIDSSSNDEAELWSSSTISISSSS